MFNLIVRHWSNITWQNSVTAQHWIIFEEPLKKKIFFLFRDRKFLIFFVLSLFK